MSKRPPIKRRLGPQPSLSDFDELITTTNASSGSADSTSATTSTTPSGQAVQPQQASTNSPSGTAPSTNPPGNPELYAKMKTNFGRALARMHPDELRRILDETYAESIKPLEE